MLLRLTFWHAFYHNYGNFLPNSFILRLYGILHKMLYGGDLLGDLRVNGKIILDVIKFWGENLNWMYLHQNNVNRQTGDKLGVP
jgi:hypothetical protein